ncbi:MAG: molybdenum cofactor guanylyltransferase [Acidobacteriota bacterium]
MSHGGAAVGVVLAGGGSRRMGRDKARLHLPGGPTLLDHAIARLRALDLEVLLAAGERLYDDVSAHVEAVADGAGVGPAAGILGAAAARPGRDLLVLAVDLPLVPVELLASLCAHRGAWVVPVVAAPELPSGERLQPTCALYRPPAVAALVRRIAAGDVSLRGLAREPDLDVVRVEPLDASSIFANLNTPEEAREAFASLRQSPHRR